MLEAHPSMLTIEEAEQRLSDVPVNEAAELLRRDGVVNRVGDMLGVSRAAVRTSQLSI